MPIFDDVTQRQPLMSWLRSFDGFVGNIVDYIQRSVLYVNPPPEISSFLSQLRIAIQELGKQATGAKVTVDDKVNPILRLAILHQRRQLASQLEVYRDRALHPDLMQDMTNQLRPFDTFMEEPWFQNAEVIKVPSAGDFLTPKWIEEPGQPGQKYQIPQRQYDDKFHILQAPTLMISDLKFYRRACAMRGCPVALVYLDIDQFKTFNTRYTESVVDRDLLPVFMRCLEAFVFLRGHGYRYGGDEYVLLLPSMEIAETSNALENLRQKIESLKYRGIEEPTTVSIGFIVVDPECYLTDREAELRANWAKNHAKEHGRNRIAWCKGPLFRKGDLSLTEQAKSKIVR